MKKEDDSESENEVAWDLKNQWYSKGDNQENDEIKL